MTTDTLNVDTNGVITTHTLDTVKQQLKIAAREGDFHTIMELYRNYGARLTLRDARLRGEVSFNLLRDAVVNGHVSNKMNREEELDDIKNYINKVHHAIRYIDGLSGKSHLALSYVKSANDNVLYIIDDGTMMALLFGEFRDKAVLNGHSIKKILMDITEYDVAVSNLVFYNKIEAWLDAMNEQQLSIKYSFNDIVVKSGSLAIFNETTIPFESNYFTMTQHIKDQQNANLQPNPWIPHNFYKAPARALTEYDTTFLGDNLLREFSRVAGIGDDFNSKGRALFRAYGKNAKRAELEIPFYMVKSALLNVQNLRTILDDNQYFAHYSKHTNTVYGKYWYEAYQQLVNTVTFQDMKSFITDFEVVIEQDWGKIWTVIKKYLGTRSSKAVEDLTCHKDDFAIYMTYVVLGMHQLHPDSMHRAPKQNIKLITNTLIDIIATNLEKGQISIDNEEKETITNDLLPMFENNSNMTNWNARFTYVWELAIKETYSRITKKVKAELKMDKEIEHQKINILRIVEENKMGMTYKAFSHQSDTIHTIKFTDHTKTMAGLHCVPREQGGTAEDGIIWGLTEDNTGDWKYQNLNTLFDSPAHYWQSLADRNVALLELLGDTLDPIDKRGIDRFITLCDFIVESGLDYKYKKTA